MNIKIINAIYLIAVKILKQKIGFKYCQNETKTQILLRNFNHTVCKIGLNERTLVDKTNGRKCLILSTKI